MTDFSSGLKLELKDMLANVEAHAREADSIVEGFKSQMEHMSTKAQASFKTVSSDIKVSPLFSDLVIYKQCLT